MLFVGLAGSAACLTMLFLAMRSVMDVGGACASGGSYEIATPCPKGIGWIMPGSIWGGLGCLALATAAAARLKLPAFTWLAWPALFISLGWNFFDFGLDPPDDHPIVWSWIVCGVLFVVMGAGPLALAFIFPGDRPSAQKGKGGSSGKGGGSGSSGKQRKGQQVATKAADLGTRVRAATTPPPFRNEADDLVDTLERLAALHRDGSLSDEEYAAAKRAMLGGGE